MRKTCLTPEAMTCLLWKAVCSETGLHRLGRGRWKRIIRYLASGLLHFEAEARGVIPSSTVTRADTYNPPTRNSALSYTCQAVQKYKPFQLNSFSVCLESIALAIVALLVLPYLSVTCPKILMVSC